MVTSSSSSDLKWWRSSSSKSNDAANNEHLHVNTNGANMSCIIFNKDVSHRVHVASEHGEGYEGNNPLQRPILSFVGGRNAIYNTVPGCDIFYHPSLHCYFLSITMLHMTFVLLRR